VDDELFEKVTTANYDDEVLRSFSLIKAWRKHLDLPRKVDPLA